ncbi:MAG: glutamine synthetase, partial [Chloroflexi bacterium]
MTTRLLERARAAGVEVVHLQFTDVQGSIKSLTIPANRLERTLENGAWFDGSSIEGMARTAESDLYLLPEPDSFAVLPWETTPTARLICDVRLPGGEPFQADPRQAL